jgi:hypothetical protein
MGICGSRHSVVNAVTDTNKQVEEHKTKEVSIIKSHQNAGGHSGEEKAPGSPVRGGWTDTEKPLKVNHEDEVQAFDQDFNDDSDKPKNISPSKSGLNARIFGSGSAAGGQSTTGASPVGTPKMKIGKGKGGEAWKSSLRKGADDIEPFEAPLNAIVPPASGSKTSNAVSRACFGAGKLTRFWYRCFFRKSKSMLTVPHIFIGCSACASHFSCFVFIISGRLLLGHGALFPTAIRREYCKGRRGFYGSAGCSCKPIIRRSMQWRYGACGGI